MLKKKSKIKIKRNFIFILCFVCLNCFGQIEIKLDTLTLRSWNNFFKTNYEVKVEGSFYLNYENKAIFPSYWIYDSTINCSECKYLFKKLNNNSSIMIMSNGGDFGTYLFYFEKNKMSKSWIQKNFVSDSIKLYQINQELYYFKLYQNNEFTDQKIERYVFFDINGRVSTQTIDFFDSNNQIECLKDGKLNFINTDFEIYFNFRKMRFSKNKNNNQFFILPTYLNKIKNISLKYS